MAIKIGFKHISLAFIAFLLFPCSAYPFSLGEINVISSFGEKFNAEIVVNNDSKKGLESFVGSPKDYAMMGIRRLKIVDELKIVLPIEFLSTDKQLIKIVSSKPLFFPSFDLIVKAKLEGSSILEKYSLAADFKKNMSISISPSVKERKKVVKSVELPDKAKEKVLPETTDLPKSEPEEKKAASAPFTKVNKPDKQERIPKSAGEEVKNDKEKKGIESERDDKVEAKVAKKIATEKVSLKKEALETVKDDESIDTNMISSYEVARGDTLSSILKKVRPQKAGFYKAVVALWKLNKDQFLYNNMNGLNAGKNLSFANLNKEKNKITNKEAIKIIRQQMDEWNTLSGKSSRKQNKSLANATFGTEGKLSEADEINEILSKWKQSWEDGNLEDHFSLYSEDFSSNNYIKRNIDLSGWKKYKSRIISRGKNIKIDIKDVKVRKKGDRLIVSFLQKFKSDGITSFGTKTIVFKKKDGLWKITKELFQAVKKRAIGKNFPFVVHISSHRKRVNALSHVDLLRKEGYKAYIIKANVPGKGVWLRVVINRFRSKKEANKLARNLIIENVSDYSSVLKLPYAISLGYFSNEDEAYKVSQGLDKTEFTPYLFTIKRDEKTIHHILVGGYETESQAKADSLILEKKGMPNTIIKP